MYIIIVKVNHKNLKDAEKIGNLLLEKKLVSCANYFPIKSSYFWQWKIQITDEITSIFKTRSWNWKCIKDEILRNHSYITPCILKIKTQANKDYVDWVYNETIECKKIK